MVHRRVAVPETVPASFVGTCHSRKSFPGLYMASPRLACMSVIFLTVFGTGTVTTTSSKAGDEGVPLPPAPPRNEGVGVPEPLRPTPGRAGDGWPGKFVLRVSRTSKSEPVGPSDFRMSTKAGRNTFSMWFGGWSESGSIGIRSTSYPARTKRPSGGTKLSSPGRSLHLASRTQGWKTGSSILRPIACWPGLVNERSKSGTPDI